MRIAGRKILSLALAVLLAVGILPQAVFALDEPLPVGASGKIIAFEPLSDSVAHQTKPLGALLEDLDLPEALTATVEAPAAAEQSGSVHESVQDSGEPAQTTIGSAITLGEGGVQADEAGADETESGNEEPATPSNAKASDGADSDTPSGSDTDTGDNEASQMTISVPVTWTAQPEYDGNTAGTYLFTAEITGFTVNAPLPQITVTVGERAEGIITAFAELSEDIRFQRGSSPELPETVTATVGGETKEIPVTWDCETDLSEAGLHSLAAKLGEGYALAEGVRAPTIAFVRTPFVLFRMAGAGTEGSPLELTNAAQLAEVAALTNAGKLEVMVTGREQGKVYLKLMNDIDLADYGQGYNGGKGWVPIGTWFNGSDKPFRGSFDGGGHVVRNLTVANPNLHRVGLFGLVMGEEAEIKNLGVENVNINGNIYVGGVVGWVSGTVSNCYSTGSVSGNNHVGGVAGQMNDSGTVSNCYSTSSVSGSGYVGGVAGQMNDSGTVLNCYSTGSVSGGGNFVGGVAGYVNSRNTVSNCYSTGSVSGGSDVGGVAGYVEGTVEHCAALNPSVTGSGSGNYVGRVAGYVVGGQVQSNYAFDRMDCTSKGSYFDNGTGKTAAEIHDSGTLFGLFADTSIWKTETGKLPGLFGEPVPMPGHINATGKAFAGDGTSENTAFEITTAAELAKLADIINNDNSNTTYNASTVYYKLMNDIDLVPYGQGYDGGEGWVPIGNNSNPFQGQFNGAGHTITGLFINRSADDQGLFGKIAGGAMVKGLGMVGASVSGSIYVGGVVGRIDGTVLNCYSTGSVSGGRHVGGVVGWVKGTVSNCYSTGSVSGSNYVGGVAGYAEGSAGTVANCAALNPSVKGENGVGRVAGTVSGGQVQSNYAFSGMGGTPIGNDHDDGTGKTADQINASSDLFGLFTNQNGWATATGKLPGLFGETVAMPGYINADSYAFAGKGSEIAPFQITTAAELAKLAELVNENNQTYNASGVHYKLMNNIDLSGYGQGFNDGEGWVPIGINSAITFQGQFNGDGHTITGLFINRTADVQGLFGIIASGAIVEGLGVVGASVSVTGDDSVSGSGDYVGSGTYVGSVAGGVLGTVKHCYSTGSVSGSGDYVGSVAGSVVGTMEHCYSTASVSGSNAVGGVTGSIEATGRVSNCYSTGSVSGSGDYVGGVVGYVNNTGTVSNCYSTGSVSGSNFVGGVVGGVGNSGAVKNCAALNHSVTGSSEVGRVAGVVSGVNGNNYAFGGMNYTSGDDSLNNGTAMTAAQAVEPAFWTTAFNWDTAPWDITVWNIADGKLPTLKKAGGTQDGEAGLYLNGKNLTYAIATITGGSYTYTGSAITPGVTVVFGPDTLTENQDYTVSYGSNTNAGTATVTVTGKGNYTGTGTRDFTIEKAVLTVTADSKAALVGDALPTPTLTYSGFVGGDTEDAVFSTKPSAAHSAANTSTAGNFPITVTQGTLNSGAGANYSVSYTNGSLVVSAVQQHIISYHANGGSGSMTSDSVNVGAPYTIRANTFTKSNHSFAGWRTAASGGTFYAAETIISAVNTDITLYAQWSYIGGGSSSGDNSKPTVIVTPAAQPDHPTIGSVSGKVSGTTAQRTFTITDSLVKSALEKAQAEAKAQNRTAYGVGVRIALDVPVTAGLAVTFERAALNRLVGEKAKWFEITDAPISITFDAKALADMQKQSTSNVTITVKPVTVENVRNAYDITLTTVKDGKTISIISLGTGTATLFIPFAPAKGEAAGGFYAVYVDGNGKVNLIADSSYDANRGSVIFAIDHFSVYGVGYTAPSAKFTDTAKHWASESIDYVVGRGLLSGTSETIFAPDTAMTRGMLVTALGRLANVDTKAYTSNSFTDVKADSAFRPYIEWAYKKGIVQGIGNSQFAPDRAIAREEIAVIFANYAKATGYTLPVTRTAATYADASGIGSTYKTAVTAMQQAGIMMGGTNNKFNPKSSATRAEVSSMLHRYIKLTIDPTTAQGWAKNDAGQYLYYKDGKAVTGTQTIDGVKYFFETTGVLKTGWVKDDTGNWHFYSGNIPLIGWWDIGANGSNKRYYFDTYGNMVSGKWLQIDGKWYYFYDDGSLARSTTVDGYEVDENGARRTQ
ncbi:GLUG motif-containing protein [Oscillibacter sp.]|uniref:GLUG motif-containing protein n=1 Tax=Oscillibacter sp. TaxID=1945593 RepID=UPI00289C8D5F|nr:GLUG motif-containing protein [Oscillibacter sp.]